MSADINPAEHAELVGKSAPLRRAEHFESALTRVLEQQAAKIPSHFFLAASLLAMTAAALLELRGRKGASRFIAAWPSPLLMMGVYNKLVKTFGA